MSECRLSAGATKKFSCSAIFDSSISEWSYDMEGHAKKCVEQYCELANKTTQQQYKVCMLNTCNVVAQLVTPQPGAVDATMTFM